MKKKLLAILVAAVSAALLAFAGCASANVKRTKIDENSGIIIVASNDVMTITENTSLEDYIKALKDNGKLTFEGSTGDYGFFLTSMDGKANVDNGDNTGYSWMVYIDFVTLEGDGAIYGSDFSTCEYDGKTLYSASYGVSSLPCVEGHTYAFVYEAYDYSAWN